MTRAANPTPGRILRPCKCGATPELTERTAAQVQIIRIVCACGRQGGSIFYIKPTDQARTRQAAIDGWNLSVH